MTMPIKTLNEVNSGVKKSEIYDVLLPGMLEVAKQYLSVAKGDIAITQKGQLEACQDVWKTLNSISDQASLEELIERLENTENEQIN